MFRSKLWADIGWPEFQAAEMSEAIAVLPVAATEQHGPHLPVGVDTFIMQGYLARAMERIPAELPVLVLPIQAVGKSNEHTGFPGTLSLSAETVIRTWTDIGESVFRTGCRKLVIVNSHGGNIPPLDIVARDLRVRFGMLVVVASWARFGYPDGLYPPEENVHGIHAGEAETSLMLAFRPDLVRLDLAEDFVPSSVAIEREFTWLRVTHPVGFGWAAQDVSAAGAMGNAAAATAQKGEASADYGATAFVELLQDVHAFDLGRLGPGPLGGTP